MLTRIQNPTARVQHDAWVSRVVVDRVQIARPLPGAVLKPKMGEAA